MASRHTKRFAAALLGAALAGVGTFVIHTQSGGRGGWTYYGGDKAATRYSPLDQITRENVKNLRVAWRRPAVDPQLKQTDTTADLLVLNGRVHTAVEGKAPAEAVAVRGNTIMRVGATRDVEALRGANTTVIDARGGAVVPGFNDSHVHFLNGAMSLDQVDLAGLTKLEDIQARYGVEFARITRLLQVLRPGRTYSRTTSACRTITTRCAPRPSCGSFRVGPRSRRTSSARASC